MSDSPSDPANDPANDLDQRLAALTARVRELERAVDRLREQPSPALEPSRELAAASAPEPLTAVPLPSPRAAIPSQSLESRVGSQWFNRIGIVALLIGAAWFLKFAFDSHWIGPAGRIVIGVAAGSALIAWSERFRRHGYPPFSYSLKALGSGILYLSLWAAFAVYALVPSAVALIAMVLVTAFNGFMAWRQNVELLALYAIAGGLATPLLLSTGRNEELFLFSYLLIMNVAAVALLTIRQWTRLLLLSFLGTVAYFVDWYLRFYAPSAFAVTAVFVALFFLLFACAAVFPNADNFAITRNPQPRDEPRDEPRDRTRDRASYRANTVLLLLSPANAAFGFLSFYAMLTAGDSGSLSKAWSAVAFGGFYLALRKLGGHGQPFRISSATLSSPLAELQLVLAIGFFTIAIALALHGHWITIGWLLEGVALLWLALRLRTLQMRVLGVCALVLGLVSLALNLLQTPGTVVLNARFATFLVAIAAFAAAAWLARRATAETAGTAGRDGDILSWRSIALVSAPIANLLVLLAVGFEIDTYWWSGPRPASARAFADRQMYTQFTYSAWALFFGAILLATGFWRRLTRVRWQALVLIALGICKVFLVDTSQLSQGYRIVSFVGLGVLLLAVSFAYQKDWLRLRAGPDERA
ncbi:MAG: DUF2339 domain-containing protein [Acidobacteriaceae bacterium]